MLCVLGFGGCKLYFCKLAYRVKNLIMNFEGIKTKSVDNQFVEINRSVFTPKKLIRRRNLKEFSQPSKADMILDAGFCRGNCEDLFFAKRKRRLEDDGKFRSCMETCFGKLKMVDDYLASDEYGEFMI